MNERQNSNQKVEGQGKSPVPARIGIPVFASAASMWKEMDELTRELAPGDCIRNFVGTIVDMSRDETTLIETELFPRAALDFYTAHNLDLLHKDDPRYAQFYTAARGGGQGDYRQGIKQKINNVVDALKNFPASKRAVLTVPAYTTADHTVDADAKCLRELHFYTDDKNFDSETSKLSANADMNDEAADVSNDGAKSSSSSGSPDFSLPLHCTGFMRAQAASIFPKNIHFIAAIMRHVANELGRPVGSYTHCVTTVTNGRE